MKNQRIPDIQVMLGLWFGLENTEKVNKIYGGFNERLNGYLKKISITDTIFEMIPSDKGYLCFYLRKPLSDFLRYEDQESEVIKFLDCGLKAISNLAEEGDLSKIMNDNCFK